MPDLLKVFQDSHDQAIIDRFNEETDAIVAARPELAPKPIKPSFQTFDEAFSHAAGLGEIEHHERRADAIRRARPELAQKAEEPVPRPKPDIAQRQQPQRADGPGSDLVQLEKDMSVTGQDIEALKAASKQWADKFDYALMLQVSEQKRTGEEKPIGAYWPTDEEWDKVKNPATAGETHPLVRFQADGEDMPWLTQAVEQYVTQPALRVGKAGGAVVDFSKEFYDMVKTRPAHAGWEVIKTVGPVVSDVYMAKLSVELSKEADDLRLQSDQAEGFGKKFTLLRHAAQKDRDSLLAGIGAVMGFTPTMVGASMIERAGIRKAAEKTAGEHIVKPLQGSSQKTIELYNSLNEIGIDAALKGDTETFRVVTNLSRDLSKIHDKTSAGIAEQLAHIGEDTGFSAKASPTFPKVPPPEPPAAVPKGPLKLNQTLTPEQASQYFSETSLKGKSIHWKAAKGMNLSQAARFGRAREMGFDTEKVWYHGVPEKEGATAAKENFGQSATYHDTYFAPNPAFAIHWAGEVSGAPDVIPVFVKKANILDLRDPEQRALFMEKIAPLKSAEKPGPASGYAWLVSNAPAPNGAPNFGTWEILAAQYPEIRKDLSDAGFGGILLGGDNGTMDQIAIWDQTAIRHIDAVFDPKKAKSKDIYSERDTGRATA